MIDKCHATISERTRLGHGVVKVDNGTMTYHNMSRIAPGSTSKLGVDEDAL